VDDWKKSRSARSAWIEIIDAIMPPKRFVVALRTERVD